MREGVSGGVEQAETCCLDAERIRVDRWNELAAVDVDVGDEGGGLDGGDSGDASDHGGSGLGQFRGLAEERLTVLDGEHVGAELVDLGQEARLRG